MFSVVYPFVTNQLSMSKLDLVLIRYIESLREPLFSVVYLNTEVFSTHDRFMWYPYCNHSSLLTHMQIVSY